MVRPHVNKNKKVSQKRVFDRTKLPKIWEYTNPDAICIEKSISCHVLPYALQIAEFNINLVEKS